MNEVCLEVSSKDNYVRIWISLLLNIYIKTEFLLLAKLSHANFGAKLS